MHVLDLVKRHILHGTVIIVEGKFTIEVTSWKLFQFTVQSSCSTNLPINVPKIVQMESHLWMSAFILHILVWAMMGK